MGCDSSGSLGPFVTGMADLRRGDDRRFRAVPTRFGDGGIGSRTRRVVSDVSRLRGHPRQVRVSTQDVPRSTTRNCDQAHDRHGGLDGIALSLTSGTHSPHVDWTLAASFVEVAQEEPPVTGDGVNGRSEYVLAIDAGTTGVRSRAVFVDERPPVASYREFTQHFPQPGWVEHDAEEIWQAVVATVRDVIDRSGLPTAIGITNQRETVVAWNRTTGRPLARAIVWQDRRTAERCERLAAEGRLPLVRERTGLVLDPYFSGTKMAWLLDEVVGDDADRRRDLVFGTIDTWIVSRLTGGEVFATDPSNASRTMLFDIAAGSWSDELCDALGVPPSTLADVRASSERWGTTSCAELPSGIPISGVAGDQQSALFGQACFHTGMAKNTYGTGSFVLMNVGDSCPAPRDGLLTTVAWTLRRPDGRKITTYALEGAIFVTGAAVQWLRDGLEIIGSSAEIGPSPPRSPIVAACSSSRPSPDSAARGGIRTRVAPFSESPAARLARISRVP